MDAVKDAEAQINTQKSKPLYKMFNNIPKRYDLMNRLLTFRFDESWRRIAIRECLKDKPESIIDLCTGTGDMAVMTALLADHSPQITAMDFSEKMLEFAQIKSSRKGLKSEISFHKDDVSDMQFPGNSFDAATISFAFRNITFKNPLREKALKEIHRILKPGGKFIIIESSQPSNAFLKSFFKLYLNIMVKRMGGLLSGHKSAYNYLAYSARNYYNAREVDALLLDPGFKKVKHKLLMGGCAAIHVATK